MRLGYVACTAAIVVCSVQSGKGGFESIGACVCVCVCVCMCMYVGVREKYTHKIYIESVCVRREGISTVIVWRICVDSLLDVSFMRRDLVC